MGTRNRSRRRLGALAVAAVVTLVGGLVVGASLREQGPAPMPRDDDPVVRAWELPETPYLWPENWARAEDRAALAELQAAADVGAPEIAWRRDPKEVVRRFLRSVLAWDEPSFVREIDPSGPGRTWGVAPSCPGNTACDPYELEVSVGRPIPGSDVWSVVSVRSDALTVSGDERSSPQLPAGSQVRFDLDLPEDRSAHAGLVASNGCEEASGYAVGLAAGTVTLPVPEAGSDEPPCGMVAAGYLFVYTTDDTTVPVGDPLLEAAAIEYPWLTMLPVEVQMGTSTDEDP